MLCAVTWPSSDLSRRRVPRMSALFLLPSKTHAVYCRTKHDPLVWLSTILSLIDKVRELDQEIAQRARRDDVAKPLMTILGVGPVIATALEALAPPAETFMCGRDSAWMGQTPRQHSTGGKARLGKTSKMGQHDLRRLLIVLNVAIRGRTHVSTRPHCLCRQKILLAFVGASTHFR